MDYQSQLTTFNNEGILGMLQQLLLISTITSSAGFKALEEAMATPSSSISTTHHNTPIVQGELYTYLNDAYFQRIQIAWYYIGGIIGIFTLWSSIYMIEVLSSENILDFWKENEN